MTTGQAALLGLVQGATEFLPVSSDGHLVLAQRLLGLPHVPVLFDVLLHLGTLAVTLAYFRRDLVALVRARDVAYLGKIVVAGAATFALAFPLKDRMEAAYFAPGAAAGGFWLSAAFLLATRGRAGARAVPTWRDALLVGLAQGLAPLPGASRSGLTIAVAALCGVERLAAMRFSFLLSLPTIGGAVVLKTIEGGSLGATPAVAAVGVAAAAASGAAALPLLARAVGPGAFHRFAAYLLPVGLLALLV